MKLLLGTDNGKATLAGRGNLSLQSVQFYLLIRDRALLVLSQPQDTVNTNCEAEQVIEILPCLQLNMTLK